MSVSVESQAHRKLRLLERYLPPSQIPQNVLSYMAQFLNNAETIVGCYQNDGGSSTDWIVFTTHAISAKFDEEWRHIPYSEILGIVREDVKDIEADEVCLELRSRIPATMLVNGKDLERATHDKYSIMMFLEAVIGT